MAFYFVIVYKLNTAKPIAYNVFTESQIKTEGFNGLIII